MPREQSNSITTSRRTSLVSTLGTQALSKLQIASVGLSSSNTLDGQSLTIKEEEDVIDPSRGKLQCGECGRTYVLAASLNRHFFKLHVNQPEPCSFLGCKKTFTDVASRRHHQRAMHQDRQFSCSFPGCKCAFTSMKSRKRHQRDVHENQRIPCLSVHCTRAPFRTTRQFKDHLNRFPWHREEQDPKRAFRCPFKGCLTGFRSEEEIYQHVVTEHWMATAAAIHSCPQHGCFQSFQDVDDLYEHFADAKHSLSAPGGRNGVLLCAFPLCQCHFPSQYLLEQHHAHAHRSSKATAEPQPTQFSLKRRLRYSGLSSPRLSTTNLPAESTLVAPVEHGTDLEQLINLEADENLQSKNLSPTVDPALDFIADPASDYIADLGQDYDVDPILDFIADPITDYMVDPTLGFIANPATDQIVDPNITFIADPITDQIVDTAPDFIAFPTTDHIVDSTLDFIADPTTDHIIEPTLDFIANPAQDFIANSIPDHTLDLSLDHVVDLTPAHVISPHSDRHVPSKCFVQVGEYDREDYHYNIPDREDQHYHSWLWEHGLYTPTNSFDTFSELLALDPDERPMHDHLADHLDDSSLETLQPNEFGSLLEILHFTDRVSVDEVTELWRVFVRPDQRRCIYTPLRNSLTGLYPAIMRKQIYESFMRPLLEAWTEFRALALQAPPQIRQGHSSVRQTVWTILRHCMLLEELRQALHHSFLGDDQDLGAPTMGYDFTAETPFESYLAALHERALCRAPHEAWLQLTPPMILTEMIMYHHELKQIVLTLYPTMSEKNPPDWARVFGSG